MWGTIGHWPILQWVNHKVREEEEVEEDNLPFVSQRLCLMDLMEVSVQH